MKTFEQYLKETTKQPELGLENTAKYYDLILENDIDTPNNVVATKHILQIEGKKHILFVSDFGMHPGHPLQQYVDKDSTSIMNVLTKLLSKNNVKFVEIGQLDETEIQFNPPFKTKDVLETAEFVNKFASWLHELDNI